MVAAQRESDGALARGAAFLCSSCVRAHSSLDYTGKLWLFFSVSTGSYRQSQIRNQLIFLQILIRHTTILS